jgi:hypothetical protein
MYYGIYLKINKLLLMARNTSPIFKLQGTVDGLTFVKSRRYKPHTRRKRGTVKKVTLNPVFAQNKEHIITVNDQAKLLFRALKNEHHDGGFWSRLVSLFFQGTQGGRDFPLESLQRMEINEEHTLDTLLGTNYELSVKVVKKQLRVGVTLLQQPDFGKNANLLGYELGVVALFPDFAKETCHKEVAVAPIVPLRSALEMRQFVLPMPAAGAPFVLLLRVAGSIHRGKTDKQPSLNGLAVVWTRDGK